jgi:hypothetical protein
MERRKDLWDYYSVNSDVDLSNIQAAKENLVSH